MRAGAADTLFGRVARRYAPCGIGVQAYVAGKLRRDPGHRDVLEAATQRDFGDVLDIGCGRGQLGIALLEAGLARSVLGLDRMAARLDQARHAARGLAFRADLQDFAEHCALAAADTVLLVDILYQLEPERQAALLRDAARAARRHVMVRTLDPARGVRSAITVAFERAAHRVSPHSGAHVSPLPLEEFCAIVRREGFAFSLAPCWRGTLFANVLLTAWRPAQPDT